MFFQIAQEIMLLLPINDTHEKCSRAPKKKKNNIQCKLLYYSAFLLALCYLEIALLSAYQN